MGDALNKTIMSLDISIKYKDTISVTCPNCDKEHVVESKEEHESHWQNITHNLGRMAREAGIYDCLWRAPENGFIKASQLIEPLEKAISEMKEKPDHFKQFDSDNGWGTYKDFLPWLKTLLQACKDNPNGTIEISR